jgi:hypothetical protein
MRVSKELLREAAQLALRGRDYEVEVRAAPGAAPGARLAAVKGRQKLDIAVRTSRRRAVGLIPGANGGWKTVSRVDQILVAVPSPASKPGRSTEKVEVLCFDAPTFTKAFEDHARKLGLTIQPEIPVFVPLDAVGSSGSTATPLKALALWRREFAMKELHTQSSAKQLDQFIARVTSEFAELVGIDAERVTVDFRISSKSGRASDDAPKR